MEKQQHFNIDLVINFEKTLYTIGFLIKISVKENFFLHIYGPTECFFFLVVVDCEIS